MQDKKVELGFYKIKPLSADDYATIKVIERGKTRGRVVYNDNVARHIKLWEAYKTHVSNIRVLDPACGSGAFLNEVFDFLYQEGQVINRTLETFYGGQTSLFRWDTHILSRNIFGVDINRESVEITKLSLWLKTANRNEKLSYLDDNIKAGNSLINDRKIAGDLAFDWKAAFRKGGFDIVLGNPPYVDSEAMTKVWPRERSYITKHFQYAKGNWDLYVAFLELGCDLMAAGGYLSFITPDKWISKDFGIEIRKRVLPGLVSILPIGRDVFESALVDSIITTVASEPRSKLQVQGLKGGNEVVLNEIAKKDIDPTQGFDQLLSSNVGLLKKLELNTKRRLSDWSTAENACATSDTYELAQFIKEAADPTALDLSLFYKVANTGTLDPFAFRWGFKQMRYLGNDYLCPIVKKKDFSKHLGKTYQRRAASPKLIIKGLTLLDGALDLNGEFIPGKATIVICNDSPSILKQIAGVLNSQFASFYVKQKYASASYNGGVNFTPDMINSIPVPELRGDALLRHVDRTLECRYQILSLASNLHKLIDASSEGKRTRKLDSWFLLSDKDFLNELAKQGVKASLKERAEWLDLFSAGKKQIARLLEAQNAATASIDKLLFDALDLTPDERAIIEANC